MLIDKAICDGDEVDAEALTRERAHSCTPAAGVSQYGLGQHVALATGTTGCTTTTRRRRHGSAGGRGIVGPVVPKAPTRGGVFA